MGASEEAALPAPFGVVLPALFAVVPLSAVAVVPAGFSAALLVSAAFPQPVAAVIRTEAASPIAISRFMDIFLYLLTFNCLYWKYIKSKGKRTTGLGLCSPTNTGGYARKMERFWASRSNNVMIVSRLP